MFLHLNWIKKILGFEPKVSTKPINKKDEKPANPIDVLDGKRKNAVSEKENLKTTSTDWYRLNPISEDKHKEVSVFVRYSFADIVTLKFLKEERIRKEKERIVALTIETNTNLSKIEAYVEKEDLQNSETLLQKVAVAIPDIKDAPTTLRYKTIQGKVETLKNELERRILQRIAEERKRKEEEDRKRREQEEREQREKEERERKERERREAEARRLAEEAKKRELAEMAERERLQSLCSRIKDDADEIKDILSSNGIHCFYHFTDRCNIPSIKRFGGLYSWAYCKSHGINIPSPGSDNRSRELDMRYHLEDYVRLSFCRAHPMKFVAKNEGRIMDPVVLQIDIDVAFWEETLFSDMNATKTGFHKGGRFEDIERVRFDIVKLPNHFDLGKEEKPYFQAEILVKTWIPIKHIRNINNL